MPAPALPRDLEVLVVDTGASATTQGMVDRVLALPDRAARLTAIGRAATSFLNACATDDAEALIAAVDAARSGMVALGAAAGVDIVSEQHARIAAVAASLGGAAKPSGAGGGDIAVAFVPRARAAELRAALSAAALPVVDVRIGAPGVRIDP
ncbi:MAG: hypothetical protein A2138_17410 [Deltaproteobacteria bacterium RBG_16_71_12]|nr:MAG: hypothetical protein A2138_17410 [Deltaproteobacteria bacterium RBG_16_71_12]